MTRLLYRLLQAYFSYHPAPMLDRIYRSMGVVGIHAYRRLIRPWIDNECQFQVTCSQLTLELISGPEPFPSVSRQCLQRYCECSRPFDRIRIGHEVTFISNLGREVPAEEVAPTLREL